jgi:hypothetical protein
MRWISHARRGELGTQVVGAMDALAPDRVNAQAGERTLVWQCCSSPRPTIHKSKSRTRSIAAFRPPVGGTHPVEADEGGGAVAITSFGTAAAVE